MDSVLAWGCIDESAAPAARFYALRETTGTTAYNTGTVSVPGRTNKGNGTYRGGVVLGAAGPDCGYGPVAAVTLDGATGWISTARSSAAPDVFTTQVWFRTSAPGGRLFGVNSQETGAGQYDRHVYMTDAGALVFGVYRGTYHTVSSPAGTSYADGRWHLVTATLGSTGMRLYVDGQEVAANAAQTTGEPMAGSFWRFGGGELGLWPDKPTNPWFSGSLSSAAVFDRTLTAAEVARQYRPVR
nr:LamG domain-containing protein [Modestobacter muralis]